MFMDSFRLTAVALDLFDGEGGGGESAGTGAEGTGNGGSGGHEPIVYQRKNGRKTGDMDKVVYGKQPTSGGQTDAASQDSDAGRDDAGRPADKQEEAGAETPEAKRARFQALINGEFKDEFSSEFQNLFNRRFKDAKANEETLGKQKPIMDMLLSKYGIQDGDLSRLSSAIENDNAMWQQAADSAGVDVDTYKTQMRQQQTIKGLQEQLNAIKDSQQESERQRLAREQLQGWYDEGEALKAQYPDFNFAAEIRNPQFQAMLRAGTPVKHAYEVLHLNQILADASSRAEKRVADSVKAKGSRPAENGMSAQSGIVYKSDVSKLTKKDRAEIAARAARGETITF